MQLASVELEQHGIEASVVVAWHQYSTDVVNGHRNPFERPDIRERTESGTVLHEREADCRKAHGGFGFKENVLIRIGIDFCILKNVY